MTFDLEAHAGAIERNGYTIIEDFMDAARLAEVRRVLGFYLGSHTGRNPFEGHSTERVYTLVARGRVFWDIALDERVLALCDRFLLPGCLLTASQAICIRPGEQPQDLHHDDTFYTVPRPRPMISISTIAAVDAFTADNGGTEIIPGSHLWGDDWRDRAAAAPRMTVTMPAGACVVFSGTLVHRGGREPLLRAAARLLQPVLPALGAPAGELSARGAGRSGAADAAAPAGDARLLHLSAVHGPADRQPPGQAARAGVRKPRRGPGARRRGAPAGVIQ